MRIADNASRVVGSNRGLDLYDSVLRYRPTSLLNNEWLRGPTATFTELQ